MLHAILFLSLHVFEKCVCGGGGGGGFEGWELEGV